MWWDFATTGAGSVYEYLNVPDRGLSHLLLKMPILSRCLALDAEICEPN
jgi:hypothetical protein